MLNNQNMPQSGDETAKQQTAAAHNSNIIQVGASGQIGGLSDVPNNTPDKNLFDRWLTEKLHTVFDTIAQEPLPPDLLKLVKQLEAKEKSAQK